MCSRRRADRARCCGPRVRPRARPSPRGEGRRGARAARMGSGRAVKGCRVQRRCHPSSWWIRLRGPPRGATLGVGSGGTWAESGFRSSPSRREPDIRGLGAGASSRRLPAREGQQRGAVPAGRRRRARRGSSTPNGIRTRATAVKGRRPRPLDDGGPRCEQRLDSIGAVRFPAQMSARPFSWRRSHACMVSPAWAGSSVGTSVRLKSGRSAVRPRPCPQAQEAPGHVPTGRFRRPRARLTRSCAPAAGRRPARSSPPARCGRPRSAAR